MACVLPAAECLFHEAELQLKFLFVRASTSDSSTFVAIYLLL